MNIVEKDRKNPLVFSDLKDGDVFRNGVNIYMKVCQYEKINAVLLGAALPATFLGNTLVEKLEHELVIK